MLSHDLTSILTWFERFELERSNLTLQTTHTALTKLLIPVTMGLVTEPFS
jgi:hypothetical protein